MNDEAHWSMGFLPTGVNVRDTPRAAPDSAPWTALVAKSHLKESIVNVFKETISGLLLTACSGFSTVRQTIFLEKCVQFFKYNVFKGVSTTSKTPFSSIGFGLAAESQRQMIQNLVK